MFPSPFCRESPSLPGDTRPGTTVGRRASRGRTGPSPLGRRPRPPTSPTTTTADLVRLGPPPTGRRTPRSWRRRRCVYASVFPVSRAELSAKVLILLFLRGAKEFLKCLRIMQFVQFPLSCLFFARVFFCKCTMQPGGARRLKKKFSFRKEIEKSELIAEI